MDKCMKCGRGLSNDETGLHKKLFGTTSTEFMCLTCCAEYLSVSEDMLNQKIKQFKDMGCMLFCSN